MPLDSSGNYSLPAGSTATTGQTILASQHNNPVQDIAAALSQTFIRDGRAPMTGNLPMGAHKITNLADGVEPTDAATVGQLASVAGVADTINNSAAKATPADADRLILTDSAASYAAKRFTWANLKTALSSVFALRTVTVTGDGLATGGGALSANRVISVPIATQPEAEAGSNNTKGMTALRVKQAIAANAGGAAVTSVFTGSGTWTKPANAKAHLVQLWAAGGGGGIGVGGGGGEYVEVWLRAADLGATQAVVIGSGGGGDGGNSSFAGIVANGGRAPASPGTPGIGGTGSNAPTCESGGAGGNPTSGNTFYSGAGGGNSGGVSLFGGNRGQAPGGGGNTGSGSGARGEIRITTFF